MRHLVIVVVAVIAVVGLARSGPAWAEPGVACNMDAHSRKERVRHAELRRQLIAAVVEKTELPNGYALRLKDLSFLTVAEWVSLESRCCPFLDFQLEQRRNLLDGKPPRRHERQVIGNSPVRS